MRIFHFVSILAAGAALVLAGCGSDVQCGNSCAGGNGGSGNGGGSTGTTTGTVTATTGTGTTGTTTATTTASTGTTTTTTTSTTTSTSTGTKICGGLAGIPCATNEYCDFADGSCGGADQLGVCVTRPLFCPVFELPPPGQVCGCDGKLYLDECTAASSGTDLSAHGGCKLPPGKFACGSKVCDTASQYCQITYNDVPGVPAYSWCGYLPSACTASVPPGGPTCACLAGEACSSTCKKDPSGGFTVTCPGG